MKRIMLLTTIGQNNPGDSFVSEGIKYLLEEALPDEHLIFDYQHAGAEEGLDRIDKADLLVFCGTPLFSVNKNYRPEVSGYHKILFEGKIFKTDIPLLMLGIGSAQSFSSDGSEFKQSEEWFKQTHERAKLITVRDSVTWNGLTSIGLETKLLPCPSLFAGGRTGLQRKKVVDSDGSRGELAGRGKLVCLNYMKGAGHWDFDEIDSKKWENEFLKIFNYVREKYVPLVMCHHRSCYKNVSDIIGEKYIYCVDYYYHDYLEIYSQAMFGVMNRVHGAFALAGFGIPSITIGNDSRLKMLDEIGLSSGEHLPYYFVNDVSADMVIEQMEEMMKQENIESIECNLKTLQTESKERYISLIREAIK